MAQAGRKPANLHCSAVVPAAAWSIPPKHEQNPKGFRAVWGDAAGGLTPSAQPLHPPSHLIAARGAGMSPGLDLGGLWIPQHSPYPDCQPCWTSADQLRL